MAATPLPVSPRRDVRMTTDVDRATADQIDAFVARYSVPRAEVLRALIKQALQQHEAS